MIPRTAIEFLSFPIERLKGKDRLREGDTAEPRGGWEELLIRVPCGPGALSQSTSDELLPKFLRSSLRLMGRVCRNAILMEPILPD